MGSWEITSSMWLNYILFGIVGAWRHPGWEGEGGGGGGGGVGSFTSWFFVQPWKKCCGQISSMECFTADYIRKFVVQLSKFAFCVACLVLCNQ